MRLSVQLYTLRQPLAEDFAGTLKAVKDIGFEYVELAGYNGQSAAEVKKVLDDLGLKVSGGHYGLDALEDVETIAADSNLFHNKHVILPWIGEDKYKNGWVEFGKELEPLARAYTDRGFMFCYHNHAFEFENRGVSTFDQMWAETEADVLKSQLDLGWVAVAGLDPAEYLRKLGNRVCCVHLKEFSGNKESWDAEAGKGVIDWDSVIAACNDLNIEFGAIEMDNTPDEPLVSVRRSAEFFFSKGLK